MKGFPLLVSLSALLVLSTGCDVFRASPGWSVATSLHVGGKGDYKQSEAYAKAVSSELTRRGIENKLVTFRYTVAGNDNAPQIITRSSVIYRDETGNYPWWLIDNMLALPVWLPNGSVAEQVHFVTRYEPEIIAVNEPERQGRYASSQAVSAEEKKREFEFYKYNASAYDPESELDRRKMKALEAKEAGAH